MATMPHGLAKQEMSSPTANIICTLLAGML